MRVVFRVGEIPYGIVSLKRMMKTLVRVGRRAEILVMVPTSIVATRGRSPSTHITLLMATMMEVIMMDKVVVVFVVDAKVEDLTQVLETNFVMSLEFRIIQWH